MITKDILPEVHLILHVMSSWIDSHLINLFEKKLKKSSLFLPVINIRIPLNYCSLLKIESVQYKYKLNNSSKLQQSREKKTWDWFHITNYTLSDWWIYEQIISKCQLYNFLCKNKFAVKNINLVGLLFVAAWSTKSTLRLWFGG